MNIGAPVIKEVAYMINSFNPQLFEFTFQES